MAVLCSGKKESVMSFQLPHPIRVLSQFYNSQFADGKIKKSQMQIEDNISWDFVRLRVEKNPAKEEIRVC